ncbi:MAG: sel1 repeat family protein [Synergistaceae bacterium]|jgi:TPR repeat protein|nr:sel1 repeat family protein [Synergistaceae bacterium]
MAIIADWVRGVIGVCGGKRWRAALALFVAFALLFGAPLPAALAAGGQQVTPEQAFSAVKAAAEGGDAGALVTLGGFYAEGFGAQKNFSLARECYEKAAQAGSADGIYNVGVCWEIGMGSAADAGQAAECFRRAADMGMPQALFKMSVILDAGAGVARDEKMSIEYMAKAASAGHPDAAGIMGLVYLNGLRGQAKNPSEGLKMLNAAASAGNVEAMKNIAVVYKDGLGVKASPAEALKWYTIAEKCGYPAQALASVKKDLGAKLTDAQRKKAESDADAWMERARKASL